MFKVECPGCKAPYQVDERRVPSSGLKMRCPKCGTSFKVDPPSDGRRTGPSPVLGSVPDNIPAPRADVDLPSLAQPPPQPAPPGPPRPRAKPEPNLGPPGPPPLRKDPYGEVDLPAIGRQPGASPEAHLPALVGARGANRAFGPEFGEIELPRAVEPR